VGGRRPFPLTFKFLISKSIAPVRLPKSDKAELNINTIPVELFQ